ncbi:hypothetical protein ABK040_012849 [Willaertia magna]
MNRNDNKRINFLALKIQRKSNFFTTIVFIATLLYLFSTVLSVVSARSFSQSNIIESKSVAASVLQQQSLNINVSSFFTLKCTNNPALGSESQSPDNGGNGFLFAMNGCHFDPTSTYISGNTKQVLYRLSNYILQWFNTLKFVNPLLFALCFLLPFLHSVYDDSHYTEALGSNFAFYILQTLALFYRLAIIQALSLVLILTIRQPCPCLCEYVGSGSLHNSGDIQSDYVSSLINGTVSNAFVLGNSLGWCMPSEEVIMGTVLIMHILERYSIFVGIPALIILPTATIFSGESSLGQIITAVSIGIIYHFYSTRTPLIARSIDFIVTFVAGIIALFVTKHFYPEVDFAYTGYFFEGLIFQIFCILMLLLCFSMDFLKLIMLKWSLYSLSPQDIQYMNMKLLPDNQNFSTFDQQLEDIGTNDRIGGRRRRINNNEDESTSLVRESSSSLRGTGNVFSKVYHKKYLMMFVGIITFIALCGIQVLNEFSNEILSFGRD